MLHLDCALSQFITFRVTKTLSLCDSLIWRNLREADDNIKMNLKEIAVVWIS